MVCMISKINQLVVAYLSVSDYCDVRNYVYGVRKSNLKFAELVDLLLERLR
jgi:hypothetical protein